MCIVVWCTQIAPTQSQASMSMSKQMLFEAPQMSSQTSLGINRDSPCKPNRVCWELVLYEIYMICNYIAVN